MVIPAGRVSLARYRVEVGTAQKRRLYTQLTWWFGGFYDGDLDAVRVDRRLEPDRRSSPIEFTGERNVGRLPTGDFTQTLVGNRLRINVSPDLSIASYVQYDTDSDSVGVNTRLRWTFTPVGDLFVVYNHNVRVAARALAARVESVAGQAAIRLADVTVSAFRRIRA